MLGNATIVNPGLGEPPTGEPDAGDPPVRFGGRGGSRSPYPYQVLGDGTPSSRFRQDTVDAWRRKLHFELHPMATRGLGMKVA